MSSWTRFQENYVEEILLILISNKSIGNIIGKLNTLIIIELFFTWCPIADTRVKQLDMLNDPRTKRHKKNEVDTITFPIRRIKNPKVNKEINDKKIKL